MPVTQKTAFLDSALYDYLLDHQPPLHPALQACHAATMQMPDAKKQSSLEQGHFLSFLIKLLGAKEMLELGTFTGYGAMSMALAGGAEAHVVTCDIKPTYLSVAQEHFEAAGLAPQIDARAMSANDCLDLLQAANCAERFDFIFIDADKQHVQTYYEKALLLLTQSGVIVVDNTLWYGNVIDETVQDKHTQAIRAFNAALVQDARVDFSFVPVADGMTLIRKKEVA